MPDQPPDYDMPRYRVDETEGFTEATHATRWDCKGAEAVIEVLGNRIRRFQAILQDVAGQDIIEACENLTYCWACGVDEWTTWSDDTRTATITGQGFIHEQSCWWVRANQALGRQLPEGHTVKE